MPQVELSEFWPFLDKPLDDEHRLVIAIASVIPHGLSEEVRREVGQEAMLGILRGDFIEADLGGQMQRLVRLAYKSLPDRFGALSLDAPLGGDKGGRTLADYIADLRDRWCDSGPGIAYRDSAGELIYSEGEDFTGDEVFPVPEREPRARLFFRGRSTAKRDHHIKFPEKSPALPSRGRVWVCP